MSIEEFVNKTLADNGNCRGSGRETDNSGSGRGNGSGFGDADSSGFGSGYDCSAYTNLTGIAGHGCGSAGDCGSGYDFGSGYEYSRIYR